MTQPQDHRLDRAIAAFDVASFARTVGGRKESLSPFAFEWLFSCPYCASSRLRFNTQKQTGVCWVCKKGFTTFSLVRDVLKLDEYSTIEWFISRYVGGDSTAEALSSDLHPMVPVKPSVRRLPPIDWPVGAEILTVPCAPHARAWHYLHRRGITIEMVREFALAFGRGGRVKDRIVFPHRMDGAVVYWQARATWDPPEGLTRDGRKQWIEETRYIKTINPLAETMEDVQAHEVLYNYDRAAIEPHVVIVEGPIDAIKVGPHAVALDGKIASPTKIERLKRMRASRFTIYLDRGEEEWRSACSIATELCSGAQVAIAVPPAEYDAGALTREYNAAVIAAAQYWQPGKLL